MAITQGGKSQVMGGMAVGHLASGRVLVNGGSGSELDRIYRPIRADLDRADAVIRQTARESRRLLRHMSGYLMGRRGKRIRAALVLFSVRAGHADSRQAARLAAVVEMLHLASLVHDDILDESKLRRGRPALHAIWGMRPSILMGDFLFSRISNILTSGFPVRVLAPVLRAAEEMCEGEIDEESAVFNAELGKARYLGILQRKTAGLMGACCESGARLAGATEGTCRRLRRFGTAFGMGFQLADDAMNFASTRSELGKPVRSDLAEGRFTWPVICLRSRLKGRQLAVLKSSLTRSSLSNGGVARVVGMVRETGCIPLTFRRAAEYFAEARQALKGVPTAAATPLGALADYAAGHGRGAL